jgi:hypothetical protein
VKAIRLLEYGALVFNDVPTPTIARDEILVKIKSTTVNHVDLGFVPLSKTGAEMLFEIFSQRYERSATMVTSNLPFNEWTEILGSERLTGALLDRLTHHVHVLEMNGESYRLKESKQTKAGKARA